MPKKTVPINVTDISFCFIKPVNKNIKRQLFIIDKNIHPKSSKVKSVISILKKILKRITPPNIEITILGKIYELNFTLIFNRNLKLPLFKSSNIESYIYCAITICIIITSTYVGNSSTFLIIGNIK